MFDIRDQARAVPAGAAALLPAEWHPFRADAEQRKGSPYTLGWRQAFRHSVRRDNASTRPNDPEAA